MAKFQLKSIQELFRQLMRGPTAVRRRNADRIEALLAELDPARLYPYEFVYFRVSGFRLKQPPAEAYAGRTLLPDLAQGLRMLSASVARPASEAGEKVYTDDEICRELKVAPRTVRRWRRRGLVGAVYAFPDGRARLGVRSSALAAFLAKDAGVAGRARHVSRLARTEEAQIADMARRLVRDGGMSLTAAAGRIARELGRARETVRACLRRHDRDHPDRAIFGGSGGRLGEETRRRVYTDHRQGASAQTLCARYGRSRASIYRIINRERAAEALREALTSSQEALFTAPDVAAQVFGEEFGAAMERLAAPSAALARTEETAVFRAYNYAKFRMSELRRELNPRRYVPSGLLDEIDGLRARAERIREGLVRAHLPLADQIARQHARDPAALGELAAEGRTLLGRLVESYDYRKRGRFSRYVSLELMKAFARLGSPGRSASRAS